MRHVLQRALVGLAALGCSAAAAHAGPPPTVVVIDSSGSMAAQEPDGRTRLDAARATIARALAGWPEGGDLAVIAYGHRRQGDCADIETIVPLGPLSLPRVEERLAKLRARGKTPIGAALEQAAGLLPDSGGTIVLVSDGLETCGADPCAVAEALRRANAGLVIHVIGLGMAHADLAQLSCIADNGGGRPFDAADASGLAAALSSVAEEIVAAAPGPAPASEPEPGPAPAPAPAPEPAPRQVRLAAVAGALGEIVDAPVRWRIVDEAGRSVYEGASRGLGLTLPAGAYRAEALADNARGQAAFTVSAEEDARNEFAVEVEAGRLDLALAAHAKAEPFTDLEAQGVAWTIEPGDGQGAVEVPSLARPSLLLAPGRYTVRARLQGMEAEAPVEIVLGKPVALTLDFRLGSVTLEAALTEDGPPLDDDAALAWRIGEGGSQRAIEGEARPRVTLPEGTYPVALAVGGGEIAAQVEVKAGEDRVQRVIVKGGELALSARLGPQSPVLEDWRDTFWRVEPIAALGVTAGPEAAQELPVAKPTLTLAPGRWRVSIRSGAATAEREVTIAPETVTPLVVELGAARLAMRARPAAGTPSDNVVFEVHALAEDGTPAPEATYAGGAPEELYTILPAGHWRVTAVDSDNRRAEADLTLGPGEERSLELVLQ